MKPTTRFALNATTGWLNVLVGGATSFWIVAFLVREFSPERYGITVLMSWLVVMLLMIDGGIRTAMGRQLAEHIAAGNLQRINELITSVLAGISVAAVAAQLVALAAGGAIVDLLQITGPDRAVAMALVRYFVVPYALMQFVTALFGALVEAEHRFDLADAAHIAETICRALLIALALGALGLELHGWAAAMLVSKGIGLGLSAAVAWRVVPTLRLAGRNLRRNIVDELSGLASVTFVQQLVQKLTSQTDVPILSSLYGPAAAAFYNPALLLVTFAQPFSAVLSRQLRPLATANFTRGRHELIRELLVRGTRVGALVAVPFTVVFVAFAFPLVRFWLGEGYAATSWTLIAWAVADLASNATSAQWQVMLGLNRVRLLTAVQTIATVINIAASITIIVWAKAAGWPMQHAIPAIVIPTIVVSWVQRTVITVHVARTLDVGLIHYLMHGFASAAVLGLGLTALAFGVQLVLPADTPATLIAEIGLTMLVWAPLAWWLGFDAVDRRRVLGVWNTVTERALRGSPDSRASSESATAFSRPETGASADRLDDATVSDALDQTTEE
ncbi:MAG: lipopolysaccharide biosynthesis protein [Pirellulales bacterium]|nr:lipopolysaccharide biosynthesis protein [Pirellulales bacterium]